jgi:cell division protein FtsB
MKSKIQNYYKLLKDQIAKFGDIKFTGQIVFLIIVLLVTWSGINAIQSNYSLQQQVSRIQQENQVAQLENSTIALQNQYYKSQQYLDLSARQNFGLAKPGETELLVPKNVALSYTSSPPNYSAPNLTTSTIKSQSNYLTWIDFFLHRSQ